VYHDPRNKKVTILEYPTFKWESIGPETCSEIKISFVCEGCSEAIGIFADHENKKIFISPSESKGEIF
jgi:hypothetical protein